MAKILVGLLILALIYALALVLVNGSQVAVNLLFMSVPLMNLGLLLILCLALGLIIGGLLAVLAFRVFQNRLEMTRLINENARLKSQIASTAHPNL